LLAPFIIWIEASTRKPSSGTTRIESAFSSHLGQVCTRAGWQVHAFVLMSNHYHLLIETPQPNLVADMRWIQTTYGAS
jgi:REP element-mobilizing transposase RayT